MNSEKDTLKDEYPEDLIRSGVRGKYAKRYRGVICLADMMRIRSVSSVKDTTR